MCSTIRVVRVRRGALRSAPCPPALAAVALTRWQAASWPDATRARPTATTSRTAPISHGSGREYPVRGRDEQDRVEASGRPNHPLIGGPCPRPALPPRHRSGTNSGHFQLVSASGAARSRSGASSQTWTGPMMQLRRLLTPHTSAAACSNVR